VFASVGAVPQTVIHWQLNINNVNGHDQNQLTFKDNFWPASIMPDLSMVGITAYNRAFGLPGKDYSLTFDQTFESAYNQVCAHAFFGASLLNATLYICNIDVI
jgi:hypothetical protein